MSHWNNLPQLRLGVYPTPFYRLENISRIYNKSIWIKRAAESRRPAAAPDPALVQTPRPSTDGMRRVGVRQAMDGGLSSGSAAAVSGEYVVGQRVEHPKFGVGIVQRIETLSTDHKLVVAFDNADRKSVV